MKLNLGCGSDKRPGYVNADVSPECNPDKVVDLESFPWPFDDSCANEIVLSHVLEHLGAIPSVFLGVMKELYRVCKHQALLHIIVPHPRHDEFLYDPTHVRAILPETFQLFSKTRCEDWRARGVSNTPLALICGVDFEIEKVSIDLDPIWVERAQTGQVSQEDIQAAMLRENNVVKQFHIQLRVLK